jgi:hypothetical protein
MEADLASTKESKIPLAVQAVSFLEDSGQGRVYIELEFSWQSLKYEFKQGTLYVSFGALLMIYNRDGTLAARLSDFACCDYGNDIKKPAKNDGLKVPSGEAKSVIPDRLETQIEILPGIYELRAIFSDGENFGRKHVPLTIEPYGAKHNSFIPIARGIDLSTLADGPYRLEVQATAAGQDTPWHAANFEVEPGNIPEIILPPASRPAEVTLNIKALEDTGNPVTEAI